MNKGGLTSITFRGLSPEEIIRNLRKTSLTYIEWGSDVHVPEGDLETAENIRALTEGEGIKISSYGTYYKLGQEQNFIPYLESAKALNAPVLRIWAGTKGSREVDSVTRSNWVTEAKVCCKLASEYGLRVAFEYHPNTLTDDALSAKKLVEEINEPNCRLYWQPNYQKSILENITALKMIQPYVEIIHVFFWSADSTRHFLSEGKTELLTYLRESGDVIKLIEFVPDDNIEYLMSEAKTLLEIL